MKTRDVAGWLLPVAVLIVTVPVALGRALGVAVSPDQAALASFAAAIAALTVASNFSARWEPPAPEPKASAPNHGRLHERDSARVG